MWSQDPKWKPIWGPIEEQLKEADSLIVISPEYHGMSPAALKNFFLFCSPAVVGHKPALLVGVSAGQGGAYPIQELRGSSFKNNRILYIPDHVILREVEKVLNSETSTGGSDDFYRKRLEYSLNTLAAYEGALKTVRESGVFNYKDFPNGM